MRKQKIRWKLKWKSLLLGCLSVLLLFIAGCGQGTGSSGGTTGGAPGGNTSGDNNIGAGNEEEKSWELGHGELPSIIKRDEIPTPIISGDFLYGYGEAIYEETEYEEPSGIWFLHNGEGKLGYGLPAGTMQAGNDWSISLYGHEPGGVPIQRDVRIQLTEREDLATVKEVIIDEIIHVETVKDFETIYSGQLPDKENVIYLVSMEIRDESGEVEDTMVSFIHVPIEEINAGLMTDESTYSTSDKELKLMLENYGPTTLFFGVYYSLEKLVDGKWRVVPQDLAFIDIGIMLSPGEEYEENIDISGLTPGEYRVVKSIQADGLDLQETLAAEFTIQ